MSWGFFDDELYNPGGTDSDLQAEVSLPNGATINKFVVYYWDDCGSHDLSVRLERSATSDNAKQPLAEASTFLGSWSSATATPRIRPSPGQPSTCRATPTGSLCFSLRGAATT